MVVCLLINDRIPDKPGATHELPNFDKLASRTADETLPIPADLPICTPRAKQYRFSETSIYPDLETNICARAMEFSQEPIPDILSTTSIYRHGEDSPFRHHSLIQKYIEDLVNRHGYPELVSFDTTVELARKTSDGWELTLRKEVTGSDDYWYKESFDALVVASGHYIVPYIPPTEGLAEFATAYPGSVEHSKSFRGAEKYKDKVRSLALRFLLKRRRSFSPSVHPSRAPTSPLLLRWRSREPRRSSIPPYMGIVTTLTLAIMHFVIRQSSATALSHLSYLERYISTMARLFQM